MSDVEGPEPTSAPTPGDDETRAEPEEQRIAARRLGELWDRAHENLAGWWSQAESEGRALWARAEGEARARLSRLATLSNVPRDELDRLWEELKERLRPEAARVEARLEALGRVRQALAGFLASADLERLRRRAAALEFRIRSLEERLSHRTKTKSE